MEKYKKEDEKLLVLRTHWNFNIWLPSAKMKKDL